VFWLDWGSALLYFQKLHLNWNPSLFALPPHVQHFDWPVQPNQPRNVRAQITNNQYAVRREINKSPTINTQYYAK
jgi:hypothetical protein